MVLANSRLLPFLLDCIITIFSYRLHPLLPMFVVAVCTATIFYHQYHHPCSLFSLDRDLNRSHLCPCYFSCCGFTLFSQPAPSSPLITFAIFIFSSRFYHQHRCSSPCRVCAVAIAVDAMAIVVAMEAAPFFLQQHREHQLLVTEGVFFFTWA